MAKRKMGGTCKAGSTFLLQGKKGKPRCACITKNNTPKFLKANKFL